jgi:hypothetical protein
MRGRGYTAATVSCATPQAVPGTRVDVALGDMGMSRMTGGTAPTGTRVVLIVAPALVRAGRVSVVVENQGWRTHELCHPALAAGASAGQRVPGSDGKVDEAGRLGGALSTRAAGRGERIHVRVRRLGHRHARPWPLRARVQPDQPLRRRHAPRTGPHEDRSRGHFDDAHHPVVLVALASLGRLERSRFLDLGRPALVLPQAPHHRVGDPPTRLLRHPHFYGPGECSSRRAGSAGGTGCVRRRRADEVTIGAARLGMRGVLGTAHRDSTPTPTRRLRPQVS